jgi:hypothetical protein
MEVQKKRLESVQFWYNLSKIVGTKAVSIAFVWVSIIFVCSFIVSLVSPPAGEAWMYTVTLMGGMLSACAVGLACFMVLSVGVNLTTLIIGAGIKQAREMNAQQNEQVKELPMNTDLIIAERPGEFDFSARVQGELDAVGSDKFVAVIRFRHPEILFMMSGKENTKQKFDYMFNRISSKKAKQIAKPLYDKALKDLNKI